MAWRKAKTLERLILTTHDGTDVSLDNFIGASITNAEEIAMCANPYYWSGGTSGYEGTTGTLNLNTVGLATPVGNYFYVWRMGANGRNVHVRFTRNQSDRLRVQMCLYGSLSGGLEILIGAGSPDLQRPVYAAFGFLCDPDNGLASIYWCRGWTNQYGSVYRYANTGYGSNLASFSMACYSLISGQEIDPPSPTVDPYAGGGYSTQDGGGGDFDDTSDVIALPDTPLVNLSLNHFISAYVPSINDINDLADWIWGNYDKFDSTKVLGKLFTEPMDSILSLHMLPFTPASSTAIAVTIGNFATGLTMKPLTLQFTDIDCGSLTFSEYWGNYLDYNPYTKIVLCLPFVGQVDLDADEVMGKSVSVKYRVDNLTGAFVCFVYIDSDKILGQYSGECMLQVPVTAGSYAAMNAAIATIACTAAASFGGATAAAIGGGYGGMIGVEKGLQMGGQALGETLASGSSNVNGMKLQVSHSGALTGTAGFLGVMKPYAIIHRPRQCVPEHYNELAGYPSNITKTLGDCSGFTSVRTMVYDGLPFTDGEILALDSILKGGIFI